jgi:hypothetical protein
MTYFLLLWKHSKDNGGNYTTCIKLLGMDIDKNLTCLDNVHEKTVTKITNITRFWSRFWLSLPGRINIYKTLCLSQINYIGSFLLPTPNQLKNMITIMENFVKGKLSVSRERLYNKISEGGLGLIEVSSFLKAQQTLWIKRIMDSPCDNWREDVWNITYGNLLVLHPSIVNKNINPIIFGIAQSFVDFKKSYFGCNENFRKMHLFLNPLVDGNINDRRPMDIAFFRQMPQLESEMIAKLKFNDIYAMNPLSFEEVNRRLDQPLNFLTYLRLTGSCRDFIGRLKNNRQNNGTSLALDDFFGTFKKGSSSIRRFLECNQKRSSILQSQSVKKFLNITNNLVTDEICMSSVYKLWGEVALPNAFREFLYKFFNNCLGINTRLSHFVQNQGRGCTFCDLVRLEVTPDETFLHLFYNCPTVASMHQKFYAKYFNDLDLDNELKQKFWFGILPVNFRERYLFSVVILLIQFGIWSAKLKKKLPSFFKIKNDMVITIATAHKLKKT